MYKNSATPLIQRHQGGSSWDLCIPSEWMFTSKRSKDQLLREGRYRQNSCRRMDTLIWIAR